MQDDPFDFAGMLCARLCHDLVGPVGALGNGLELLALDQDPAMRQQTLALMASSVGAVAAKLQFFRLAFGTALQTAINDFYALRPHIQIKWVTEGGDLPHPMARILAVFAMLAGDALLRGGDLDIAVDHTGPASEIVVRAAGERVAFDAEHRLAMEGGSAPYFDTRTVPAQLAARLADRFGMTLQISPPESAKLLLGATAQS